MGTRRDLTSKPSGLSAYAKRVATKIAARHEAFRDAIGVQNVAIIVQEAFEEYGVVQRLAQRVGASRITAISAVAAARAESTIPIPRVLSGHPEWVEACARAMCKEHGENPDRLMDGIHGEYAWLYYRRAAAAALSVAIPLVMEWAAARADRCAQSWERERNLIPETHQAYDVASASYETAKYIATELRASVAPEGEGK